jgi:hypothetical protein
MTKDQAVAFIAALNNAGQYVPPLLMAALAHSDVGRLIHAVANEQMTCAASPSAAKA